METNLYYKQLDKLAPKRFRPGEKVRVKKTSMNRKYGLDCSNLLYKDNRKVWASDVGTVVDEYWENMYYEEYRRVIEFSHGRTKFVCSLFVSKKEKDNISVSEGDDLDQIVTAPKQFLD